MNDNPETMAAALEFLAHTARENGASDATAVLTSDITVDESLTNFCRDSGCENYGLAVNCPPNVSGPAGFRELLKGYDRAVVFRIDVPTEVLLSKENRDVFRSLHKIASGVEKAAIEKGYVRSKAFAGGSCKRLFCEEQAECRVLAENGKCRHPQVARPSMSGFGINVSRLVKTVGWEMDRITCKTDPEAVKTGMLCGLVLIGS